MYSATVKILCVIPGRPESNSMIFARNECNRLHKSSLNVKAFYLDFSIGFYKLVSQMLNLKKLIRQYHPEVVHAHFGSLTALICAILKESSFVITYRGSDLNPSPSDGFIRDKLQKLFSQLAALKADTIICVSEDLKRRLWWNLNRVRVITTGVDTDLFIPIDRNESRQKLGLYKDDKIVLFVGGGTPEVKRLDLAKASINNAVSRIGKIRFIILDGNIAFTDMPLYYNAADCLLLTSDYEGSPCAIQEAIACGLPIVSVEVGDVKERLKGVIPSKIVDRDPTAIGKAISDILIYGKRTNGPEMISAITTVKTTCMLVEVYKSCI